MKSISWKKGLQSGIRTLWELAKIIFPITVIIQIIQYTPLMDWLTKGIAPFMSWIGLSGDAAIPLVLGNVLNLYAAIGAILTLDLSVKEVFILATMLSFSHNMFIESAICKRVGVSTWLIVSIRIGLAMISAFLIHWIWQGGSEPATMVAIQEVEIAPVGWGEIIWFAVLKAANGVGMLAIIIIPLMFAIQILKDFNGLNWFASKMSPLLKPFGVTPKGSITMTSGLLAGLMFGAGLILEQAKENPLPKRDITIIFIFLAVCHAVIEDTLIFIPLGIPVIYLLLIRVMTALVLTWVVAKFWNHSSRQKVDVAVSSS
ncbi:nucleoside recognition domain-containing protein [Hazenella coriacea]|uniref:Nucleoside recognition protein n=1 Tax=Hazenella coriacea TaxID=1179467 RepID=A0A4R3L6A6_9BACL|nr:nucleoside recognition domain-containing protein [Hazenella coriacea]TCS95109.1 nucleoside recognition protein [Hazenella coriacea]